jgi:hypothetical protein
MPCDTVNTITVDFGKADAELLKSAMAKLYPGLAYALGKNGRLTTSDTRFDEVAVRKEMGRQTVAAQAKRFGWSVKEQADGKLLMQKGRL